MQVEANNNRLRGYLPFPLEMETCPCAICSSRVFTTLLTFDSFGFPTHTVECEQCGLVYVNPRPAHKYMALFYERYFRFFYEGHRTVTESYIRKKKWREWAQSRLQRYKRYIFGTSRVLDVGCGAGFFLDYVRQAFPSVIPAGIEPNPMMARFCREELGLEVHQEFLEAYSSDQSFDVITAFHVIEHLFDLQGFCQFLRRHLAPQGVAIVETPNVAGPWEGIGMFHLAHLYTFSPRTIANLFHSHRFEVVEVEPIENELDDSNLYVVARAGQEEKAELLTRDLQESAWVAAKCCKIKSWRTLRVLRNWAKMGYFLLRF
jgi:2-polyprenyl-3-methyl-5-hydroxy-6-metoxy-1,4-benzoquinol methylase